MSYQKGRWSIHRKKKSIQPRSPINLICGIGKTIYGIDDEHNVFRLSLKNENTHLDFSPQIKASHFVKWNKQLLVVGISESPKQKLFILKINPSKAKSQYSILGSIETKAKSIRFIHADQKTVYISENDGLLIWKDNNFQRAAIQEKLPGSQSSKRAGKEPAYSN